MKFPYKYFFDGQKLVWQKKNIMIEIYLKDIKQIRFVPASLISEMPRMDLYSKTKKIFLCPNLTGSPPENTHLAEHETLVCTVLDKISKDKNVKYSKGHCNSFILLLIVWVVILLTVFFGLQLVFSLFNKGNVMILIPSLFTTISAIIFVLLAPISIMRLIPKRINPEHVLKYSLKVVFNRRYRKFIYEETGVKID